MAGAFTRGPAPAALAGALAANKVRAEQVTERSSARDSTTERMRRLDLRQDPEVLVAGAGPVGLFAAHTLTRAGVPVRIIDDGMWACAHTYALALHPRTIPLLAEAGIADELLAQGWPVTTLAFYDKQNRCAEIQLDGATGRPMIVLPQSVLEATLEQKLEAAGVRVEWRHKVKEVEQAGDGVRVHLDRYEKESCGYVIARTEWVLAKSWTVDVPFVIGADGYASAVRRSMEIRFPETGPSSWYGVFEFQSDADLREVRVMLGEQTTDVLWPLGGEWFRWSFELPGYIDAEAERFIAFRQRFGEPSERIKDRRHGTAGEVNILPDSELHRLIAERAPWFSGSVRNVGWRTVVRFERRLAASFGQGRCWLAGDSAHLGSPIAVQSLNRGLVEARDLSRAIASALRNGRGTALLQEYSETSVSEWKKLLGVDLAVEPHAGVNPWVWENRSRILSSLPAYGADFSLLARQIGLRV